MKKRNLIIDGRQKKDKRILEYFVTLTGWMYVVMFLTQVLLSMLLWGAGIHYVRRFIISNEYLAQTIHLLLLTVEFGAVVLCITLYWSYYNKFRYGKLQRRKPSKNVSVSELSVTFSVPEEFLHQIQEQRWVNLDGEIEQEQTVGIGDPLPFLSR